MTGLCGSALLGTLVFMFVYKLLQVHLYLCLYVHTRKLGDGALRQRSHSYTCIYVCM